MTAKCRRKTRPKTRMLRACLLGDKRGRKDAIFCHVSFNPKYSVKVNKPCAELLD